MIDDLEKILNEGGFETIRLDSDSERDGPVWECKIGLKKGTKVNLKGGADFPMRVAVEKAFEEITGLEADFNFSGWGAKLNSYQEEVVDEWG